MKCYHRVALATVFLCSLIALSPARAHEGEMHAPANKKPSLMRAPAAPLPEMVREPITQPARPVAVPAEPEKPPHGGQVKMSWRHIWEVVYEPQLIRIYLYDSQKRLLSPRGVVGDVVMEVQGNPRQWRYPVEFSPGSGPEDPDHLIVRADVSKVRDGDMLVLFDLNNLPHRDEPQVRFGQFFALTRRAARVVVAKFAPADQAGVEQQKICPVTKDGFDHGEPIKLLVDGRPLYVCCEACIEEVTKSPDKFSPPLATPILRAATDINARPADGADARTGVVTHVSRRPVVTVSRVTNADRAEIARQKVCPITHQPLGAHGPPLRVTVDGQNLYVCCEGCVGEVQKDPGFYVAPPSAGCAEGKCSNCRAR